MREQRELATSFSPPNLITNLKKNSPRSHTVSLLVSVCKGRREKRGGGRGEGDSFGDLFLFIFVLLTIWDILPLGMTLVGMVALHLHLLALYASYTFLSFFPPSLLPSTLS